MNEISYEVIHNQEQAKNLSEMAEDLKELASFFKLEEKQDAELPPLK